MQRLLTLPVRATKGLVPLGIRIITVMGLIAFGSYNDGVSSAPAETPPAQVTSPSPSNKAFNVPITQQLSWGAASDATSYNVYFGTSVIPPFVITTTSTTYNPGALTNQTMYYWRIDSNNTAGTTTGDVWSFTTVPTVSLFTFNYTGGQQTWVVPTGVTSIRVDVKGAQGGNGYTGSTDAPGGNGARVQTTLAVKPTERLYIYVGGQGRQNGAGGYNGGGSSGTGTYASGGGGASDIRQGGTALSNRVVIAGGGGGGGYSGGGYVAGGAGGVGSLGSTGGDGGTQSAGGAGGYSTGSDGTIGVGGNGGIGDRYYGGGGGGGAISGMGSSAGGGGSGYSTGTGTSYAEGFQTGNGLIIITYGPSSAQVTTPSPGNGATGVSITTSLSWAAASNATSYDVYFGASWPVTFITNQTGTTYQPGTLLNNTVYYWRIDSKNTIGTTIGIVWTFNTVSAGAPPVQVTTPSPADGATGIPITRQL